MRLDKYLQVARILKRRTLSKDLILLGRVSINGKPAKPASEVKVDDVLTIDLRDVFLRVKIEEIKEHVRKEDADRLYKVLEEVQKHPHLS
jgi:ribosomal 50S subunit-recycling heat shock protein